MLFLRPLKISVQRLINLAKKVEKFELPSVPAAY